MSIGVVVDVDLDGIVLIRLDELDDGGPPDDELTATTAQLLETADVLADDCRSVLGVLGRLEEALRLLTGSETATVGGMGVVAASLHLASSAVRHLASTVVHSMTDRSLDEWVGMVTATSSSFDSYVASLAEVTEVAGRSPLGEVEARRLEQARWEATTWRVALSGIEAASGRIGDLVDSVMTVARLADDEPDAETASGAADAPESAGIAAGFRKRIGGATDWARNVVDERHLGVSRVPEATAWMLRPLAELRDDVGALPGSLATIRDGSDLLELLLELAVAQVRAQDDPAGVPGVVRVRVHGSVVIPRLAQQLASATAEHRHVRDAIARLDDAAASGRIEPAIHAQVAREYHDELDRVTARLAQLEAHAESWRETAPEVLAACGRRVENALAVLEARAIAEATDVDVDQRAVLERERARLARVELLLRELAPESATPAPPPPPPH